MRIRAHLPSTWLAPGFEVALGWLWCGLGGALVEPWWSLGGALVWLWCGFGVALWWLCTPESMPSIWLWSGFGVALGWLWVALGGFSAHPDPRRDWRRNPTCSPDRWTDDTFWRQGASALSCSPGQQLLQTATGKISQEEY